MLSWFFSAGQLKKGIQVVQIFKMKTVFVVYVMSYCFVSVCVFMSGLLLFDDSGSAGQMRSLKKKFLF